MVTSRSRKALLVGTGLALVLGTAGCSKYTEQFKDAPRSGTVNDDSADTITFPDGFNNIATKCDHGNRVYVTFHSDSPYGSVAVSPQDPTCGAGPK